MGTSGTKLKKEFQISFTLKNSYDLEKNIIKQKYIKDNPGSIPKESLKIIQRQMKRTICKIKINNSYGTGFFCNIPFPNDLNFLPVLITNNDVLGENDIFPGKDILISIADGSKSYVITIDETRLTFTSEEYDITIKKKKKDDNLKIRGLEIDNNAYESTSSEYFDQLTIYLIYYNSDISSLSSAIIKNTYEDNYNFKYICLNEFDISGGPILNLNNYKLLGINKFNNQKNNNNFYYGVFLRGAIEQFFKISKVKKENEYIIKNFEINSKFKKKKIVNNNEYNKSLLFVSLSGDIIYSILCKNNCIFADVEKILYEEYPELKNKNIIFTKGGINIDKNKTISENKCDDGFPIFIEFLENNDNDNDSNNIQQLNKFLSNNSNNIIPNPFIYNQYLNQQVEMENINNYNFMNQNNLNPIILNNFDLMTLNPMNYYLGNNNTFPFLDNNNHNSILINFKKTIIFGDYSIESETISINYNKNELASRLIDYYSNELNLNEKNYIFLFNTEFINKSLTLEKLGMKNESTIFVYEKNKKQDSIIVGFKKIYSEDEPILETKCYKNMMASSLIRSYEIKCYNENVNYLYDSKPLFRNLTLEELNIVDKSLIYVIKEAKHNKINFILNLGYNLEIFVVLENIKKISNLINIFLREYNLSRPDIGAFLYQDFILDEDLDINESNLKNNPNIIVIMKERIEFCSIIFKCCRRYLNYHEPIKIDCRLSEKFFSICQAYKIKSNSVNKYFRLYFNSHELIEKEYKGKTLKDLGITNNSEIMVDYAFKNKR